MGASNRDRGVTPMVLMAVVLAFAAMLLTAATAQADRGVIATFGAYGNQEGRFFGASGVDVLTASGDVYISDAGNWRVQRFDEDGNFELAFGWGVADGSAEVQVCTDGCQAGIGGEGAGQFGAEGPSALAVDSDAGLVYVFDPSNRRIQRFEADGNFDLAFGWGVADGSPELQTCTATCLAATGGPGAGVGQLGENTAQVALAVDPTTGNLLVSDPANFRIQEFDAEGQFVRSFGRDVEAGGGEGFEVCTDATKCKAGIEGSEPGALGPAGPASLSVDANGVIYAAESSGNARLERFTPDAGTLVPSYFATGEFPVGTEAVPFQVAVDRASGDIVVTYRNTATFGTSLKVLNPDGSFAEAGPKEMGFYNPAGLTSGSSTGRGYITGGATVYVIDHVEAPQASIEPVTDVTATSATLHGVVNSQGEPPARYRFEYMLEGEGWQWAAEGTVPADSSDHQLNVELAPPGGLRPASNYQVRLRAFKPNNDPVLTDEVSFTTAGAAPRVETVGTTHYTATTARLDARVNPRNAATTYRFEYGTTTAYGSSVPATEADAGSGSRAHLVFEQVSGLTPATTYHYRVVATNASGTTVGEDRTVTTRASDAPLSHGELPGPPDSDRAYEQVSMPDQGGNHSMGAYSYSADGNRVLYQVNGGTPESENGSWANAFMAERTEAGWKSHRALPARAEAPWQQWLIPGGNADLTRQVAWNFGGPDWTLWRFNQGSKPENLLQVPSAELDFFGATSDDLQTIVVLKQGKNIDPDSSAPDGQYLYEVGSGTPKLVSLLPGDQVPHCPILHGGGWNLPYSGWARPAQRWLSADGRLLFFPVPISDCSGNSGSSNFYLRDLEAEETVEVSGSPISGPNCGGAFIKQIPGSAFFWTPSRLSPSDENPPAECEAGGDVYRYDIASGERECVTCGIPGADIPRGGNAGAGLDSGLGVPSDGSRLYFPSPHRLVEGEGVEGAHNLYRLDLGSGDLKYVATTAESLASGSGEIGNNPEYAEAMTADGSVLIFRANAPYLNELTGSDNQGFQQYYRYDDRDGSLTCVSCAAPGKANSDVYYINLVVPWIAGTHVVQSDLSADGDTYAFTTTAPLLPADQNTARAGEDPNAGKDLYEWRDGKLLLVTDGNTSWSGFGPRLSGISPSGRDVYFTVWQRLTADAPDSFGRLYDARIGGGFEFPVPPPPCALEVCQGEPKGAPGDVTGASELNTGPGNVKPRAHRKHRKCGRRVARKGAKKKRCHKVRRKGHTNKAGGGR
jgi:hypothetical protein